MEIKTVAVLGAGAVGSYIIWGLDKKVKLGVIGEGERAKRLQKGCLINDKYIILKYGHRQKHMEWIY